ncbi:MAG TPA: phosphoribosylformylglycinamidine synthase subunit PurQ [Oligoflexia bacterium]|nr:phosphoribosylformylglycinamidine synthase subunit PurQ [Oligoflexia bacterium]HMP47900.1 phosphoribosylformylglycinamidine synthase subunit PurQ [Oligoflexia bacterium]
MNITVIEFPGSSGVKDAVYALREVLSHDVNVLWHQEEFSSRPDLLVIPGGASFGDYLRPGALTKSSPVTAVIRKCAKEGVPVLGIGNGFQILCELDILPGVLLANTVSEFIRADSYLYVDSRDNIWTRHFSEDSFIRLPLACYYGRYFIDARGLRDLEENNRIAFRFCDSEGEVDLNNPYNGSLNCIAGICNRHGNVLGIIAHPERVVEDIQGGTDGLDFFKGVLGGIM